MPFGPEPPPGVNGMAIASLVLGILTPCLIPGVLSVVFGIVALNQVAQTGQRGKGLAIGGLAATGTWVVVALGLVAAAIAFDDGGTDDAGGTAVRPDQVAVGDCFSEIPDDGIVTSVSTVGCDQPHEGEVYALFDLPDGDYPGEEAVTAAADDGCLERLQQDHPTAYDDPDVGVFHLYPTHSSWRLGDREIVCVALYLDEPRTGSLRE